MITNPIFLLEFLLFDGAALAWAGYELWSVRRSKDEPNQTKGVGSEDLPRHPEG